MKDRATGLRVPIPLVQSGTSSLSQEAVTYIVRVHRLVPGDHFIAFDPERSLEADAELVEVTRRGAVACIGALRPASIRPTRRVTLIQGACKGEKMDFIVRDATELGVTRIIPVITERSIARPDPARAERWRRIAVEAARQCGRGDAPVIDLPAKLAPVLAQIKAEEGTGFCLDRVASDSLGKHLSDLPARAEVVFVVGPEGGLDSSELFATEQAGFRRVRLGPLVLRTETVCAAVLGALLAWDGMGASFE